MPTIISKKQLTSVAPYVTLDNVSYTATQSGDKVKYTITVKMRTDSDNGYYDWRVVL